MRVWHDGTEISSGFQTKPWLVAMIACSTRYRPPADVFGYEVVEPSQSWMTVSQSLLLPKDFNRLPCYLGLSDYLLLYVTIFFNPGDLPYLHRGLRSQQVESRELGLFSSPARHQRSCGLGTARDGSGTAGMLGTGVVMCNGRSRKLRVS